MATPQKIHIGILSPATADRPHFKSLEQMLPPEVTVTNDTNDSRVRSCILLSATLVLLVLNDGRPRRLEFDGAIYI